MACENLMVTNSVMSGFGLELTEYVDLMCGIIDTSEDVRFLRKEKIIEGDLDDEEIVKMFNGIGRSLAKMSVKSDLRKCVAEFNKVYESMLIVQAKKMTENLIRGAAKAITFFVSILSTLILVHQGYSKAFTSIPPHTMIAITLNFDSEVILRNLMACEKQMAKNSFYAGFGFELTEYVDFMCGIIDSAKVMKLLHVAKIIEGGLSDEEIVNPFNGIGRSLAKMGGESVYWKTVRELNKVYGDIPSVKFIRETEKQVRLRSKLD
ncbi:putative UPF0481 protein [Tanacetum coccineum]